MQHEVTRPNDQPEETSFDYVSLPMTQLQKALARTVKVRNRMRPQELAQTGCTDQHVRRKCCLVEIRTMGSGKTDAWTTLRTDPSFTQFR